MDVFSNARETGSRFARYVTDLRRLFLFHGLACGQAENFVDLAVKLEESRALRLDLPALLRNIRDLEQGGISADEMLTVVALASGGEELVDGRAGAAGMMRTVGMLRMMLAGVGTWAETNGTERAALVADEAAVGRPGAGEDRVFLELAIEELRLQLGDVTRRMREMEPARAAAEAGARAMEVGAPGVGHAAGVDRAARRFEGEAGDLEAVAAAAGDLGGGTGVDDAAMAGRREDERAGRLEDERLAAERAAAAEQAAAAERAAVAERERAATWPLEERVSPLPPLAEREPAAVTAARRGGWQEELKLGALRDWRQGGGKLRLATVAAGLLLATIGIYGSLRSASARADRENGRVGGAVTESRALPAAIPLTAPAVTPLAAPVAGDVKERVAPEAERATATTPRPVVKVADRLPVRKAVAPAEAGTKVAPTAEVAAKNRRDDAAVEALGGRKTGRFLFVPAAVMETHLISSRKPVLPAGSAGGQGRVVVNAFIAKDGTVSRMDAVEGPATLINSAMAAVSWRRYRPFLVRGEPAEVVTPVVVTYGGR